MAVFLSHGPCPSCGSRDNLGHYSDGSKWCFGCSFYSPPTPDGIFESIHKAQGAETGGVAADDVYFAEMDAKFPREASRDYPPCVIDFISKYDIMVSELLQYGFVFDNKYQRLVEVVRDSNDRVIFLSGRGFRDGEKRKYISFGEKSRLLDTKYGKQHSADQRCILVEDCYSAIKIGRQTCCWPLYGTHLQHERYKALVEQFKTVHVWLDHDKFKEAMEISRRLQWAGVQSKVIVTVEDPKAQTDERIKELI